MAVEQRADRSADPMFGEAVRVKGRLSRDYNNGRKEWVNLPGLSARVALMIGVRTLSNGSIKYGYGDEGPDYRPDKYFKAFLVVEDAKSKPYYVLPESVLPLMEIAA
jgi:hypothetical protein